jgi:hypothetical protein
MGYKFNPFTGNLDIDVDTNTVYTPLVTDLHSIVSAAPTQGTVAFATDVGRFLIADGTNWKEASPILSTRTSGEDIGYEKHSSLDGYSSTYITNKYLHNVVLKYSSTAETGSVRTYNNKFQIYLNAKWNDIVINFVLQEDSTEGYALEHKPTVPAADQWYLLYSGNSVDGGLDGLPLVQQYTASMGAYQTPLVIKGRSF